MVEIIACNDTYVYVNKQTNKHKQCWSRARVLSKEETEDANKVAGVSANTATRVPRCKGQDKITYHSKMLSMRSCKASLVACIVLCV